MYEGLVIRGNWCIIILSKNIFLIKKLFVKLDINKDNLVNFKEPNTGFWSVNFPVSDEEIQIIIAEKGKTQPDHLS